MMFEAWSIDKEKDTRLLLFVILPSNLYHLIKIFICHRVEQKRIFSGWNASMFVILGDFRKKITENFSLHKSTHDLEKKQSLHAIKGDNFTP